MHVPRKRFGQNFLEDKAVVARMLAAIAPQAREPFVEIGPGLGALTDPLLDRIGHLSVVEIDRDIAAGLRSRHDGGKLDVHEGDALAFDFSALGPDLRVVGNLPYNISTPLLFHLSAHAGAVRDAHFMLQREVVERMGARSGTPAYGRLSVMLQYRWDVEPLFDVGPEAFRPVPKVWSSVVRMVPHRVLPHAADDEGVLGTIVGKAFGQRRKTLRNAMKGVLSDADFGALDIDPAARGETLDVAQFVRIANFAARRGRAAEPPS